MDDTRSIPQWVRDLYTIVVIIVSIADIAIIIMPGQAFYGVMRIVFTSLLHFLEPHTEVGTGTLADLVYVIVYVVWSYTLPVTLVTTIPMFAKKQTELCYLTASFHMALFILGFSIHCVGAHHQKQMKARALKYQ